MAVETVTFAGTGEAKRMSAGTQAGLTVLGVALALGLLGDALLRATPWGLNVPLWVGAALGGLWLAARRLGLALDGEGKWLALPALLFAGCLAWRDSATLQVLDGLGLAVCLLVGAAHTNSGRVLTAGALDYLTDFFRALGRLWFGVFPLLRREIAWDTVPRTGWTGPLLAAGRGALLALPLLLLFGALLTAADAVYQRLVAQVLHIDLSALAGHLLWIGIIASLAVGFGRAALLAPARGERRPLSAGLVLGRVETATLLGLLNALFLSFVLVQVGALFGGKHWVQTTPGLNYKDYARSGFFELVWVAALVLPILLALHAVQTPGDERARRGYTVQAGVQVVLLLVILASALSRMWLYVDQCGLTELRLYTTAFMGWLGIVFVWFTLTVLRGQRAGFASGAALAAFAIVLGLHVVNPDATIVRTNLHWAAKGHPFDADYTSSLSADAVPALVRALPRLSPDAQGIVADALPPAVQFGSGDWRSWNWGRAQAAHAVHSQQSAIDAARTAAQSVPCPCPPSLSAATRTQIVPQPGN